MYLALWKDQFSSSYVVDKIKQTNKANDFHITNIFKVWHYKLVSRVVLLLYLPELSLYASAKQGGSWYHFYNVFGTTRSGIEPTTSVF